MEIHPQNRGKAKKIFDLVLSEAGEGNRWDNEEPGVIDFISKKSGLKLGREVIGKLLSEVCDAGYLEKILGGRTGRKIVSLRILRREWQEKSAQRPPQKNKETAAITPAPKTAADRKKPEKPRLVLLVDFVNIETTLMSASKAVDAIVGLEGPLVNIGTIEAKFSFIPSHRLDGALVLSLIYRHLLIVCPRNLHNGVDKTKDKDLVDARMSNLVNIIALFNDDISHIVFVSGDGDFLDAACYAKDHGKKVVVAAPMGHLSRALEKVADEIIFF
ncbi:MAG: NYN domain-containing protein [Candidatus Niyogibacteria bacterium]|nr:MAG: NYN domain-containing protein [Candidatus Niyogibacteria bacterium]